MRRATSIIKALIHGHEYRVYIIIVLAMTITIVLIIYHELLINCNMENCIILGSDTQTQIAGPVKLKVLELWRPLANYGSEPLHPLPSIIFYSLLVKIVWVLTHSSMVLTFIVIESLMLSVGSIGLYTLLKNIKQENLSVKEFLAPILIYTLNPGLWINLYHGMLEYLISYAILPWILLEIRKIVLLLQGNRASILELARNTVLLAILILLSLLHPIASSLVLLVMISYSALLLLNILFFEKVGRLRRIVLHSILAVILLLALLTPFALMLKTYRDVAAPSTISYDKLLLETHREIKRILGWHALTPANVLTFNDNTVLQLGNYSIIYSLIFAVILVFTFLSLSSRNRYRRELGVWLLIFVAFLTLSMGSHTPIPFNIINEVIYRYVLLAKIVGLPFRFSMMAGFSMALLVGLTALSHSDGKTRSFLKETKSKIEHLMAFTRKKSIIITILVLVFVTLYIIQLSSLIFVLKVPSQYYEAVRLLNSQKPGYVYVVPSTEWVIPVKLINVTKIIEMTKGATVKPWPHNLLGYIFLLNDIPETTGSYLKPYINYAIRNNLTDLLSILFYYMDVKYISIDHNVRSTVKWLENEDKVIKNQLFIKPLKTIDDIELLKVELPANSSQNPYLELNRGLVRIYRHYGIVAMNLLKFLPLALMDRSILNSYPIMIDEVNLPYISKLVDNADYIALDNAGFYDLVLSYLYHYPRVRIMNAFDLAEKGVCNSSYKIEAIRAGWAYTGKPYYSIFDGVMQISKGSGYAITINTGKKDNYVVLVRILARGLGGYVEVNGVSKKVAHNMENPSLYEPVWIKFDVKGTNKISIRVRAMNNLYIDCIVIAPYKDYINALNKVRAELNKKRVFIVFAPYDLKADRLRSVRMFCLGSIAQGSIALPTSWNNITVNSFLIYLLLPYNGVVKVLGNASLVTEINLFKKYRVVEYKTVSRNVGFFVPYAELGISNYRLLSNDTLELIGFGSYLWRLPLKQSEFRFLVLNFSISDKEYHVGNAFGLALFHNLTKSYEVKFTLESRVNSSEVYSVSLIERTHKTPKIRKSSTIVLPVKTFHSVTAYVDLVTRNVLVLIDGVPCVKFRANIGYGDLFGLIQWGENARMFVRSATASFTNAINIFYTHKLSKDYNIDLLIIKPNNGIMSVVLELNQHRHVKEIKPNKENALVIVYFQNYRKAWEAKVKDQLFIKFTVYNLRGLSGITNIYVIFQKVRSMNSGFHLEIRAPTYTNIAYTSIAIYVLYIATYLTLSLRRRGERSYVRELRQ